MRIETGYAIGEKVWYYIEETNQYSWGKVVGIDAHVNDDGNLGVIYEIKNRHYRQESYYYCGVLSASLRFRDRMILRLSEKEVYESVSELENRLTAKSLGKIKRMTELRKGIFG